MCVRRLNAVPALWSLSLSSLSGERDHQTPNSEQTGRIQGLAAIIGAIDRHEVDAIVVQSLHHLGTSVDSLLETLAALHRHGVKLVVYDHASLVSRVDCWLLPTFW
jgi:Resolvase, N terminal domain